MLVKSLLLLAGFAAAAPSPRTRLYGLNVETGKQKLTFDSMGNFKVRHYLAMTTAST